MGKSLSTATEWSATRVNSISIPVRPPRFDAAHAATAQLTCSWPLHP